MKGVGGPALTQIVDGAEHRWTPFGRGIVTAQASGLKEVTLWRVSSDDAGTSTSLKLENCFSMGSFNEETLQPTDTSTGSGAELLAQAIEWRVNRPQRDEFSLFSFDGPSSPSLLRIPVNTPKSRALSNSAVDRRVLWNQ